VCELSIEDVSDCVVLDQDQHLNIALLCSPNRSLSYDRYALRNMVT